MPEIAGPTLALRKKRMRGLAADAMRRFLVKTRTLTQNIRSLSGGNQQKVAIAQALTLEPRLILLEEPTRGVDIQSKREIYRLLRDFAGGGNAVVMFCTEVLEIFEAADRVIVVSDGRLSAPLPVRDFPAYRGARRGDHAARTPHAAAFARGSARRREGRDQACRPGRARRARAGTPRRWPNGSALH